MKVGNKEILHSGTYLIPKGESVTGTIFFGSAPMQLEVNVVHEPPEEDKNRLKWEFLAEASTWKLTICGPLSAIASSTTDFFDFAELAGKKVGFVASFLGTPHLCTLHLQIMKET